jgi:hypothetical protein
MQPPFEMVGSWCGSNAPTDTAVVTWAPERERKANYRRFSEPTAVSSCGSCIFFLQNSILDIYFCKMRKKMEEDVRRGPFFSWVGPTATQR